MTTDLIQNDDRCNSEWLEIVDDTIANDLMCHCK